jgi:RHS repeat-associated protein
MHHDAMGSVVNATDSSGVTQWTRLYEPFGVKRSETQNSPTAPAVPLGYAGEYNESASGLYDLRARQYDPAVGRFLSEDPVSPAMTDGYGSAYAYASDQPTVFTDPSGLCWGCDFVSDRIDDAKDAGGAIKDAASGAKDTAVDLARGAQDLAVGGAYLAGRALDKGKDVATSVASTAWRHRDVARTIAMAAVSPASIVVPAAVRVAKQTARMANETAAVYHASGGGFWGGVDAFNVVWNPGYKILASGDSCLTGYGTSNGWGRGTSCASAAVQIGLFVAAPVAGRALGAEANVIVDNNTVLDQAGVEAALQAGERPVVTQTVRAELRNIVARGQIKGMPRFADSLKTISDVMDVDLRINIRAAVAAGRPGQAGLFGDGAIGATAVRTGSAVITKDDAFASALKSFGVAVRRP